MIISDSHQFAFIHVPKAGGTSVREVLQPYDETNGKHYNRIDAHDVLGTIDYVHIPLFILREHFSKIYDKLNRYATYALIRDPFSRFPSALSQHQKIYKKQPIMDMNELEVRNAVDGIIRTLRDYDATTSYLPYQYIHFQRQVDFIYDQNRQIAMHVYDSKNISSMLDQLSETMGIAYGNRHVLQSKRFNPSLVYRNSMMRLAEGMAKPVLKSFLGQGTKQWLADRTRGLFYVPQNKKLADVFESDYVLDFVRSYYAKDIEMHEKLTSGGVRD